MPKAGSDFSIVSNNDLHQVRSYVLEHKEIPIVSKKAGLSTKTDPIKVYTSKTINSNSPKKSSSPSKTLMTNNVTMDGLEYPFLFEFNSTVPRKFTAAQLLRFDLTKEIRKIAKECKEPDWDSEAALPIQHIDQALNFIQSLPLLCIQDHLTLFPFPDGSIYFQWRKNKGNYIGVSVGKENFVFNFKNQSDDKVNKGHGILNDIKDILQLIKKYGQ